MSRRKDRKQDTNLANEPIFRLTAKAAESNGVAGGSHPPLARPQGGRNLGPMTQSIGIARGTGRQAGSSRGSTPSPRRESRTVEMSKASMPDLATLEAEIEQSHNEFLASFRTSLSH